MPFLFVDYDQGAGGEYFCENLSKSSQCVPLTSERTNNNRTKVNDIFNQEFLRVISRPKIIESGSLYDVVPCHRKTKYASTILKDVFSIRISNPKDPALKEYLNYNRVVKVLKSKLHSGLHLVGEIEELCRITNNKDWVRYVKSDMNNTQLYLLAKGLPPTDKNVDRLISFILSREFPEPTYNYNLIIPYEDLFFNTENIKVKIKEIFNIDVVDGWLETYLTNYNAYRSKT